MRMLLKALGDTEVGSETIRTKGVLFLDEAPKPNPSGAASSYTDPRRCAVGAYARGLVCC
jgi:hypothetical protein